MFLVRSLTRVLVSIERPHLMSKPKDVYCCLHGYVRLTPLAQCFTDTREFQRLAFIKQLGTAAFVFSGADHSRKAHSIGVYHLARRLATRLQSRHGRAAVSDHDVELVGLAGLLHDVGHACFSHLYDEVVSEGGTRSTHEERSVALVRQMSKRYSVPLSKCDVDRVCAMICLTDGAEPTWQTDAVSGVVDVDRMDYLCRDGVSTGVSTPFALHTAHRLIDLACIHEGRLAFHPKASDAISDLLRARAFLHERVYQHRVCVAVKAMVADLLRLVEPTHGVLSAVNEEGAFLSLHDGLLATLQADERTSPSARALLERLWRRDFYQEAFREDRGEASTPASLEALRVELQGLDAIVTGRWIVVSPGAVRFAPPAQPLHSAAPRFRVTVLTRKRVHLAAAQRAAATWKAVRKASREI